MNVLLMPCLRKEPTCVDLSYPVGTSAPLKEPAGIHSEILTIMQLFLETCMFFYYYY